MGCDIHGVVQKYDQKLGQWKTYREGYADRNYNAFAILANVRNGYGFAGVTTSSGFKFISHPRGIPPEFKYLSKDDQHPLPSTFKWNSDSWRKGTGEENKYYWMGEHSHSYVTAEELALFDFSQTTVRTGVVTEKDFLRRKEFNIKDAPREIFWCCYGA
jgi:hypothetical protein